MICGELVEAIQEIPPECDISCFYYQKIPGVGAFNPNLGCHKPNSVPEFHILTVLMGWNEDEYVGVRSLSSGVELYPTPDIAHKDDVINVFPGRILAIIGTV